MRLLNVETYTLEFIDDDRLKDTDYTILSHRWGKKELLYKNLQGSDIQEFIAASPKVGGFCRAAQKHGAKYVWIDSFCINQDSSAELSEAINSMYRWYENADKCYIYLEDVQYTGNLREHRRSRDAPAIAGKTTKLQDSEWFTRGWTLQELIAPEYVTFYDCRWQRIGSLGTESICELVAKRTGVPEEVLAGSARPQNFSIGQRMSWAVGRKTTRGEDRAYSLLGIFQVSMPANYGEGATRAFTRLQEELIKHSTDQSIFAWEWSLSESEDPDEGRSPLLANSPDRFWNCRDLTYLPELPSELHSYWLNNAGLQIRARIADPPNIFKHSHALILNCYRADRPTKALALLLNRHTNDDVYTIKSHARDSGRVREVDTLDAVQNTEKRNVLIYLDWTLSEFRSLVWTPRAWLKLENTDPPRFTVTRVASPKDWDPRNNLITLHSGNTVTHVASTKDGDPKNNPITLNGESTASRPFGLCLETSNHCIHLYFASVWNYKMVWVKAWKSTRDRFQPSLAFHEGEIVLSQPPVETFVRLDERTKVHITLTPVQGLFQEFLAIYVFLDANS